MALAKKGTRTIRVGGRAYRWTVCPDSGQMILVVESKDRAGQRATFAVPYGDVVVRDVAGTQVLEQRNVVTPALVRRGILAALAAGWTPEGRGPELRLAIDGSDLLQRSHEWL